MACDYGHAYLPSFKLKKHSRIYFEGMGIPLCERFEDMDVRCEWCGKQAVDIHHISPRGRGSSKTKDYIENLIALCRHDHNRAEGRVKDQKLSKEELTEKHLKNIP
jgi:hypothetical protein